MTAAPVSAPEIAIDVRGLTKSFGGREVVHDLSMQVKRGTIYGFLGPNGSGKTTTIRMLCGLLTPDSGEGRCLGYDIRRDADKIKRQVGYMTQRFSLYQDLSVRENLEVGAAAAGDRKAIDSVLSIFPKLGQRLGQPAATLSGGERKMLAIGRALLSGPKLLLLDEPTEGVWIGVIEEIAERLRALVKEMAIVLVEQHLELALSVAEYAYVLDRGRVALEGPAASIREDPRLLQYLAP